MARARDRMEVQAVNGREAIRKQKLRKPHALVAWSRDTSVYKGLSATATTTNDAPYQNANSRDLVQ